MRQLLAPIAALGRAYMSGYDDGARDAMIVTPEPIGPITTRRQPNPTLPDWMGQPPPPLQTVISEAELADLRRRAETAETALAEVRGQRDIAVSRLASAVEMASGMTNPNSGWDDFEPAIDTDGEPVLVADGQLAGTYRMMTGSEAGGFEVRIRFTPGERTRLGSGYAYKITLPFGPDGTP